MNATSPRRAPVTVAGHICGQASVSGGPTNCTESEDEQAIMAAGGFLGLRGRSPSDPPPLLEGDCIMSTVPIGYVGMASIPQGTMGLVTSNGIAWEGRSWTYDDQGKFLERSAAAPRDHLEKALAGGGTGTIMFHDDGKDWCLTAFPNQAAGTSEVKPWHCIPGWTSQFFILPACGAGPGQIRWSHDPSTCVRRAAATAAILDEKTSTLLQLAPCEWTQDFIFKAGVPVADGRRDLRYALGAGEDEDGGDSGTQRCVHFISNGAMPSLVGSDCMAEKSSVFDFFR